MLVAQYRRAQRESSRAESSCDVHDTDEDDEDNRSQEVCESGNWEHQTRGVICWIGF